MSRRRIAIIPARGGSKRIPEKNIIDFCGRPMIAYPLEAARASGLFDTIHVSTESPRIMEVVAELGFPVDFPRPARLADDHAVLMAVLRFVLDSYASRGRTFDQVTLLMATCPLMTATDLAGGVALQDRVDPLSVLGVTPFTTPIQWAFARTGPQGRLQPREPDSFRIRSQDLPGYVHEAGSFTIFSAQRILGDGGPGRQDDFVGYEIPAIRAIDIDTPDDLEMARALHLGLRALAATTP
ncbi:MAG: acylneuraminate cytidylyltransferase family protein [Magnetococcales bacterium]|nr:acylneuraminate cytidylyltransferase family protein [Magnetococcales bacterium]